MDDGAHEAAALEMAETLVDSAPLVLATLKNFVNTMVLPVGPVEQMMHTSIALATVRNSADLKEGLAAYKEKRRPSFTGK